MATVAYDGRLRLYDARAGRLEREVRGAEGPMISVAYAPDGRTLVTSGFNGGVRLYDARTLREVGSPLPAADGLWLYAGLTPDGRQVVEIDEQGAATVWPLALSSWEAHACSVAGRGFTRSEWDQFVPGRPYRRGCA
jgi:WD40 repeat protein